MVGEVLADRYRLIEELQRGRFLASYLALDMAFQVEVEIDVLTAEKSAYLVPAQRLEEILDTAMLILGTHVASLFGWGEEEDFIYLVRERAEGTLLAEVLAEVGELPGEQVAEITGAATKVLAETYGKGLFYLGLNPGQVLLTKKGGVKLIRVGYGWILEEMEPLLAARVSPYRAPETDGGKEGARTSDVYSLAVMIREMLPRHEGSTRLHSLLERSTDPLPMHRPSSPRLLLEELEGAGGGAGSEPEPVAPEGDKREKKRGGGLSFLKGDSASSPYIPLKKRPKGRPFGTLLLILAGGVIVWLLYAAVSGSLAGKGGKVETVVVGGDEEKVTLPDLQGLTVREAEEALGDLGLRSSSREAPSRLWSAGRVAAQEPEEGSVLKRGDSVCLVVSSGREDANETPPAGAGKDPASPVPEASGGEGPAPGPSLESPSPAASPSRRSSAPAQPLPPRAIPLLSARSGSAPLYVVMDGSRSYDPDGNIARYVWYCGDGTVLEGVTIQHVYDPAVIPARFQVVLHVFDRDGLSNSSAVTVEVY
jgi:serine/threonine-protein kinase